MSKDPARRPDKARGRKRDASRTDAILKAAADLLLEVGYDRFRIQDLAQRAGCGTGAIYRRWSNKEGLVAEAIRNMPARKGRMTDDPVADLRALVRRQFDEAANKPDLVPGLIAAMRSDAGIEEAVKSGYSLDYLRDAISRIIGPDHPHLDLLAEMAPAIALLRSSFTPETVDPERLTDEVVALIQSLGPRV